MLKHVNNNIGIITSLMAIVWKRLYLREARSENAVLYWLRADAAAKFRTNRSRGITRRARQYVYEPTRQSYRDALTVTISRAKCRFTRRGASAIIKQSAKYILSQLS